MCEHCEEGKSLIERNTYGHSSDGYVGIDMWIGENRIEVDAIGEVGYPSKDSTYVEGRTVINYCPICGRKLGGE